MPIQAFEKEGPTPKHQMCHNTCPHHRGTSTSRKSLASLLTLQLQVSRCMGMDVKWLQNILYREFKLAFAANWAAPFWANKFLVELREERCRGPGSDVHFTARRRDVSELGQGCMQSQSQWHVVGVSTFHLIGAVINKLLAEQTNAIVVLPRFLPSWTCRSVA
ncbi:TPA: hypothetical protein ACH3X1_011674 [Trebouxia sp. C0004]